ncbi:MAG TPA: branched-chain amino acid aminotransferase, partial [Bacteroidales bacterium]|nr:branched-chain amino acid aminotransferase [Bacteroidales bacterium]
MEQINWKNLPFGYYKTNYNVRCYYKDGKWSEPELSSSEYINIHIAATGLHYGQEAFEGMKAFKGKDDKIRLFRWKDNSARINASARGIMMQEVPQDLFYKAVKMVILNNKEYIPPYGTGASLYIRPLLFGSGAQVGVQPSKEYVFLIFVTPVGPYFKEGFNPVDIQIVRDCDRAAPKGTGHIKVGGNYAASLLPIVRARNEGYSTVMFVDSKEGLYIDECGPANFFAIKGNKYITPKSNSILPSITNKSLMTLAEEIGLIVERRRILVEELAEFDEVGACGTAAIISPIKKISDREKGIVYYFCKDGKAGPISTKLYNKLLSIQYGEEEDKY